MISTKIKIIISAIITLIIVTSVVCLYIYINSLNDKISDLNVTIANQKNEISNLNHHIDSLNHNIDILQKNVESFHEAMAVTDNYVNAVEKAHSDEAELKQQIYEEVLVNDEARDWFNEKLPDNLLDLLNQHASDGLCNH